MNPLEDDSTSDKHQLWLEVQAQLDAGRASKRARTVVQIIFERGACTTNDLKALGYQHPPRAVGDLRDAGIDVSRRMVSYTDPETGSKKSQASYSIVGTVPGRESRRGVSKQIRDEVTATGRCEMCGASARLQVDHRIPFEVAGETYPHVAEEFMPLCPSCNRAKSWTCESCPNRSVKDPSVCSSCMWASPSDYAHVATKQVREVRAVLEDPRDIRRFDEQRPSVKDLLTRYLRRGDDRS